MRGKNCRWSSETNHRSSLVTHQKSKTCCTSSLPRFLSPKTICLSLPGNVANQFIFNGGPVYVPSSSYIILSTQPFHIKLLAITLIFFSLHSYDSLCQRGPCMYLNFNLTRNIFCCTNIFLSGWIVATKRCSIHIKMYEIDRAYITRTSS